MKLDSIKSGYVTRRNTITHPRWDRGSKEAPLQRVQRYPHRTVEWKAVPTQRESDNLDKFSPRTSAVLSFFMLVYMQAVTHMEWVFTEVGRRRKPGANLSENCSLLLRHGISGEIFFGPLEDPQTGDCCVFRSAAETIELDRLRRKRRVSQNQICSLFREHHHGRVDIAVGDVRHHGSIDDA